MNSEFIFKRTSETDDEFLVRLLVAKVNGELPNLTWEDIKNITKTEETADHLRKKAQGVAFASEVYEKRMAEMQTGDINHRMLELKLQELEEKQNELYKERIKLGDARREGRRDLRTEARMEVLMEEMKIAIESLPPIAFKPKPRNVLSDNKRVGMAICSDWHIGAEIDNAVNKFNLEIAKERILQFANDVIYYGKRDNLRKIVIANLGDMINGHIHVSTRVESEIDVVQQTKMSAELLSEFVALIANEFEEVEVVNVIGNHGRTTPAKNDAVVNENFEKFIPWYMELRLNHFDNVKIISDEKGLAHINILGHEIALVHGNYERPNRVARLNEAYGVIFNFIILGHFHHLDHKDIGIRTESIINRCLNGTDDYALGIRATSKAGQKFIVFTEKGIAQEYNTIF